MQGKKVPYLPSLGLAVSKNLLGPYKKYSNGPIIEKNNIDPFFVASCFVEYKKTLLCIILLALDGRKIKS